MACLVIGDGAFLLFRHDLVLALQTSYDAVHRVHEVLLGHFLTSAAGCYQRCLVAYIRYVGTRETGGLFAQEINIYAIV